MNEPSEATSTLKVSVDLDRCESHGQCVLAAPGLFHLDDDLDLQYEENPPEERRRDVEEAVSMCPTQAIRMDG